MKKILLLLLFSLFIFAEKLEVTADKFIAADADKKVSFIGNAHISQGSTAIDANNIVVYFADDNSTKSYRATGRVKFSIKKQKANYQGTCKSIAYLPKKGTYVLSGSVRVRDKVNKRDISGEKIYINAKTGGFSIEGAKSKQAKLVFDMK